MEDNKNINDISFTVVEISNSFNLVDKLLSLNSNQRKDIDVTEKEIFALAHIFRELFGDIDVNEFKVYPFKNQEKPQLQYPAFMKDIEQ